MANFEIAVEKRFPFEGGYQANPADSANFCNGNLIGTNLGISALGYKGFYGSCPSVDTLKALTKDQAKQIYKAKYWNVINGDKIKNQSVSELMFLFEIGNPSTISNIKDIVNLQKGSVVMASNDNPFTDAEINIINSLNQKNFYDSLKQWRINFYYNIVEQNPEKGVFLPGWLNGINKYVFVDETEVKKKLLCCP